MRASRDAPYWTSTKFVNIALQSTNVPSNWTAASDGAHNDQNREAGTPLKIAVDEFVRQTMQKMASGWSTESNSFVVSLPPASLSHEGKVPTEIRRMCGAIAENLQAALDYAAMVVATRTNPI